MKEFLTVVDYGLSYSFYFCHFILLFLTIKKCFGVKGKRSVGLFFMLLCTNSIFSWIAALFGAAYFLTLPVNWLIYLLTHHPMHGYDYMIVTSVLFSLVYTPVMFLFSEIYRRFLGQKKRSSTLFIMLMFQSIFVTAIRDAGDGAVFDNIYLSNIINIIGSVVLFIALWSFYRWNIKPFIKLAQSDADVNWNTFIIPPTIYVFVYNAFAFSLLSSQADIFVIVLYVFSTIILFLFIWAFHVIMKNIQGKEEMKVLSVEVMETLAHTIDAKDEYTKGHSVRVAKYSRLLAEKMGISSGKCDNIYYMGLLHDLGKIGVPNEIINSPTKLTEEQYSVIKTHPGLGFDILAEMKSRPDLAIGAHWHHERYDGKGYPDGKAGEDIPLEARIIAVADSYDAMTSNRSYRRYLPQDKVRTELEKNSGTQFDPEIAKCMISIIDEDKEYTLHE